MDYDIVRDARKVHVLSELLCKKFRKLGKEKFTESYYNKGIDSGDEDELLISPQVKNYVTEKRDLTVTLLTRRDYSTITTADGIAIDVIRRIGRRQPLEADKIVQPLMTSDSDDYDQYGLAVSYVSDSTLQDLSREEFHGWHGTEGYVLRRLVARALISPVTLPQSIPKIMEEIRMCYAFGLTIAIHGVCRTLIETAVTDVCLRIGVFTEAQVKSDHFFQDFPPQKRIRSTLRGQWQSEALDLYEITSRVVHGSNAPADTDTVIQKTIDSVERVYAEHASRLQSPAKSATRR